MPSPAVEEILDHESDSENTFNHRRALLEAEEGRSLSDQEIGWLLGVQARHVHNLKTRPDRRVRPSYLLAPEYAREVGFEAADGVIDTPSEQFDEMVRELPFERREVAKLLGISTSQLWRRRTRALLPCTFVSWVPDSALRVMNPVSCPCSTPLP